MSEMQIDRRSPEDDDPGHRTGVPVRDEFAIEDPEVKILVVDDRPDRLLAMVAILEDLGESIITATSGRDALRRMLVEDFAVVLLDVNMPDLGGLETAGLIRQRPRCEATPIIFVTAYPDEADAWHGYSLGAVDYITTPVVPEVLRAKVRVFVELFRGKAALKRQAAEQARLVQLTEQRARQLSAIAEELEASNRQLVEAELLRSELQQKMQRELEQKVELRTSELTLANESLQVEVQRRRELEAKLRFLADASECLAGISDLDATFQRLAQLATPGFADWCSIDLVDEQSMAVKRIATAMNNPARKTNGSMNNTVRSDPGSLLEIQRVLDEGTTALYAEGTGMSSEDWRAKHLEELRQLGWQAALCVPMRAHGRPLGSLCFAVCDGGRQLTSDDVALAEDLAHRATVAIENARLYRQLREADRRKDEFLAMLAHELRNPLAPIRSGLDLMALRSGDEEMVALMRKQVEHMVRLVDDLLDVSRIMRGKIRLQMELVDFREVIDRAIVSVRPLIASQQHDFHLAIPTHEIWVQGDLVRLVQVVSNLLHNAIKYTESGGNIWLAADTHNDHITLCVRDSGVGMDRATLSQVFELFIQADQTLERSQGGLGIGLTLVRSLVEMHGGSVTAHSEGIGKGSEFTVRLPVLHSASAPIKKPQHSLPAIARRVLVVDDNHDAAEMLAMLLRRLGEHEVQIAVDGPSGLEMACNFHPDIILLDIGLPRMNGYEVARHVREHPQLHNVLLVALTGYGTEEDRRRSLDCGFDLHLVKPPSVDDLQLVLSRTSRATT